eukprot:EG_transcript_16478
MGRLLKGVPAVSPAPGRSPHYEAFLCLQAAPRHPRRGAASGLLVLVVALIVLCCGAWLRATGVVVRPQTLPSEGRAGRAAAARHPSMFPNQRDTDKLGRLSQATAPTRRVEEAGRGQLPSKFSKVSAVSATVASSVVVGLAAVGALFGRLARPQPRVKGLLGPPAEWRLLPVAGSTCAVSPAHRIVPLAEGPLIATASLLTEDDGALIGSRPGLAVADMARQGAREDSVL